MTHTRLRRLLIGIWIAGAAAAIYIFLFHYEALQDLLDGASTTSLVAGGMVYLALGCLRGFTLIPATSLLLLGIVFFRPVPLFVLTLAGILASSTCVYFFAEALHLDEVLREKHQDRMTALAHLLGRYGFPIVVGWSFFPLLPTDAVVYVAGVMKMRLTKVLIGVAIGEGAICAIYIFFSDMALTGLGWR